MNRVKKQNLKKAPPVPESPKIKKEKKLKKRVVFRQHGNPYEKIIQLAEQGVVFNHIHTQRTTKIRFDRREYQYGINKYDYTFKEFHLQDRLKNEMLQRIETHNIEVPNLRSRDVTYMCYSDKIKSLPLNQTYAHLKEFDVNKAYYQMAFNLNLMSEDMYRECIRLPKKIRLRFIGTIATFKRDYKRKGWKIIDYHPIKNDLLRRAWFMICKGVDDCLKEIAEALGDNFLLYYVDGVYIDKNADESKIHEIGKKYGLEFKQVRTYGVTRFYDEKQQVNTLHIYKYDEEKQKVVPKLFHIKKEEGLRSDKMKNLLKKNGL